MKYSKFYTFNMKKNIELKTSYYKKFDLQNIFLAVSAFSCSLSIRTLLWQKKVWERQKKSSYHHHCKASKSNQNLIPLLCSHFGNLLYFMRLSRNWHSLSLYLLDTSQPFPLRHLSKTNLVAAHQGQESQYWPKNQTLRQMGGRFSISAQTPMVISENLARHNFLIRRTMAWRSFKMLTKPSLQTTNIRSNFCFDLLNKLPISIRVRSKDFYICWDLIWLVQ